MPEPRAIVVTGLGLVLPSGTGLAAADDVFAGRSAVRRLDAIPGLPDIAGAPCPHFKAPRGAEGLDRAAAMAVAAAEEAWRAAGGAGRLDPKRTAVAVSLSKGGVYAFDRWFRERGSWDGWGDVPPDAAARAVAGHLDLAGPRLVPVTACASGGHALVWAARAIRRGAVDAAVVGAAEAPLHPLVLGSYRRMGVLSPVGNDPAASVRPFSRTRCGFALGEGAGVLVIEAADVARARGAPPLARLRGWATGSLAVSLTDVEASGETLAAVARLAIDRAAIHPADVAYVAAHGTATPRGDLAEARAIRAALGPAAAAASVSSTKGAHGHLLGAATAVETVLAVLALRRGTVPPTANLTDPDPALGLDCTPLEPRPRAISHVLKLASGFGGQAVAFCLSAPDA